MLSLRVTGWMLVVFAVVSSLAMGNMVEHSRNAYVFIPVAIIFFGIYRILLDARDLLRYGKVKQKRRP